MKVLIFGGGGMLGHKLVQRLRPHFEVAATFRHSPAAEPYFEELFNGIKVFEPVFAEDVRSVRRVLEEFRPDIVVNAIGVIKQLAASHDVITSLTVNSLFPQSLGLLAEKYEFRLFHVSTDCVFDGKRGMYTDTDVPNALDLYGQSKHWGELSGERTLTLRTSIIGRELGSAHSLVDWFLSNRGGSVKGYRKAVYSGFPTVVFADIIRDLITDHTELSGLYQVSSEPINKFDLLQLVNERFDARIEIEPHDEFSIDRSLDSSRFRAAIGFRPLPWEQMIAMMADDPTPYDKWK